MPRTWPGLCKLPNYKTYASAKAFVGCSMGSSFKRVDLKMTFCVYWGWGHWEVSLKGTFGFAPLRNLIDSIGSTWGLQAFNRYSSKTDPLATSIPEFSRPSALTQQNRFLPLPQTSSAKAHKEQGDELRPQLSNIT